MKQLLKEEKDPLDVENSLEWVKEIYLVSIYIHLHFEPARKKKKLKIRKAGSIKVPQ